LGGGEIISILWSTPNPSLLRGMGTRSRAGRGHLSTCSGTATSRESYSLIITAFCGVDIFLFFFLAEEESGRRQRRWLPLCQRGKLVDDLFIPPETQAGRLCMCTPGKGFLRLLLLLLYTTR